MTVFIVTYDQEHLSLWSTRSKAEDEIERLERDAFYEDERFDIEEAQVDPE